MNPITSILSCVLVVGVVGCGSDDDGGSAKGSGGTGGASGNGGNGGSGGSGGSVGGASGSSGSGGSGGSSGTVGCIGAPCDQTLTPADDVVAAVEAAPNDSTLCLGAGDYGSVELYDIARTGLVTLRSTTGSGVTMSPEVGNSSFIRFESITVNGSLVNNCSTHIAFACTPFTEALLITNNGGNCPAGNQDYLIDSATFDGVDMGTYEGRLSLVEVDGAVIRNTFFGNGGVGDGVQLLGGSTNTTIGPGNVFDGIRQSICDAGGGAHCDAIQLYGAGNGISIQGNWFKDCDTFIMSPDGDSASVTDNVFDGAGVDYVDKVQFGSAQDPEFLHNTLRDTRVSFDSKTGEPASTNAIARDNVLLGFSEWKTSNGSGCDGCTFSSNLFDDAGNESGTDNVIGTPTFTGGANPAAWAGWALASGSPGKAAASDGADMGTTYYGP